MEIRKGDIISTFWFNHGVVQKVMHPYYFIVFNKKLIDGKLYWDAWIHKDTIKILYRRSSPATEL